MHVLVTGANGFVAKALVNRLIADKAIASLGPLDRLTLMDMAFPAAPDAPDVHYLTGSIAEPDMVARAFATPVDIVFHLASIPAGTSEQNYEVSRRVNLDATLLLLEASRKQATEYRKPPVFVFSSSIATLGGSFGEKVDDATPLHPELTYGYQKRIAELLIEDYTRRDWIDGRSVRLAGIVARPPQRTGQLSAFMSDIIREPSLGKPYVCPVSPTATCWLTSIPRIAENLLHAAAITSEQIGASRAWTLPAMRVSMTQLVDAVADVCKVDARALISYDPKPQLEASFGSYPPLFTPQADRLGFRHDGDLPTLVKQALSLD